VSFGACAELKAAALIRVSFPQHTETSENRRIARASNVITAAFAEFRLSDACLAGGNSDRAGGKA
jgi:hypothetical protein